MLVTAVSGWLTSWAIEVISALSVSICGGHQFSSRSDDTEETVRARLKIYHEQTVPVLLYYKQRNIHHTVDGMADMDTVTEQIRAIIG